MRQISKKNVIDEHICEKKNQKTWDNFNKIKYNKYDHNSAILHNVAK